MLTARFASRCTAAPGLYFAGLPFQHTFASAVVGGVGKDARYVAEYLAGRATQCKDEPSAAQRIST